MKRQLERERNKPFRLLLFLLTLLFVGAGFLSSVSRRRLRV